MQISSANKAQANINMTPLIDVLLVLIIIFMVITPLDSHGLNAALPQKPDRAQPVTDNNQIVLTVLAGPAYEINRQPVSAGALGEKLRAIYAARASKDLFVQGAPSLEYGVVARAIDTARGAGVYQIGLLTATITGL